MHISFENNRAKKYFESQKKLCLKYGDRQSKEIIKRLGELQSAENLHDIKKIPQARLHSLKKNYKGCFSVDIVDPYRIILFPENGDISNLKSITSVKIIRIKDTH